MELADGCLQDLKKSMSLSEKLAAAKNIAHCLDAIHNHKNGGIIHCDIACRNVLRRKDGSFSLSDFGLARYLDENGIFIVMFIMIISCFVCPCFFILQKQ